MRALIAAAVLVSLPVAAQVTVEVEAPKLRFEVAPALVVIVVPEGGDAAPLRRALADVSLPNAVVHAVAAGEGGVAALPATSPAHGKTALDGKPTAYLCIGLQCSLPVTEPAKLVETIRATRHRAFASSA